MGLTPKELTKSQYEQLWEKNDFIKSTNIEEMYRVDTEAYTSNREVYAINIDHWQCFVVEVSEGKIVSKYVITDFVVVSYQGQYRIVDLDHILSAEGYLDDLEESSDNEVDEVVETEEDTNVDDTPVTTTTVDAEDENIDKESTGISLLDFMSSDKEKYQNTPKAKKINPSNIRIEKPVPKVEEVAVVEPVVEEKPKRVRLNEKPKVKEVVAKDEPINIFRQRGEAPVNPMLNKDADMAMGDIFQSILNR